MLPPNASAVQVKTLETQAYELMREKVITGEWAQGSHLKDSELATLLGISATPVREALRKLASEGLVEAIPYRGTFVTSFSPAQVIELLDVRLGLELMAVEASLATLCQGELDNMEAALDAFDEAVQGGKLTAVLEADMAFHDLLVRSSHNSILGELYRQLSGRVQMLMAIADLGGRMATGNTEHREILQALCRRDRGGVEAALRKHLLATRDHLLVLSSGSESGSYGP